MALSQAMRLEEIMKINQENEQNMKEKQYLEEEEALKLLKYSMRNAFFDYENSPFFQTKEINEKMKIVGKVGSGASGNVYLIDIDTI